MNLSKLQILQSNPVFTTKEYSIQLGISLSSASRSLGKLVEKGEIQKLTRNVWVNSFHKNFHPFICVNYLLNNETGYISFLTALHNYGLISQIPRRIQVASTGHTRKLKTIFGIFEFFQIKPELMQRGVDITETEIPYKIASPEKALLDTFYISSRKNNRFYSLPELELPPKEFSKNKFKNLLNTSTIPENIKKFIGNKFKELIGF